MFVKVGQVVRQKAEDGTNYSHQSGGVSPTVVIAAALRNLKT